MVDEHQLVQVLLNIRTNTEQAIHEAGRAGHIDVRTRELDNRVEITIKGDGPGMAPEVIDLVSPSRQINRQQSGDRCVVIHRVDEMVICGKLCHWPS